MSRRKPAWAINHPTERKVRNAGFVIVRHTDDSGRGRMGWIIDERGSVTRIALVTADPLRQRVVRVRGADRRRIVKLDDFREAGRRARMKKRANINPPAGG